ncbi:TetR/AcrR family transcriptional regulator [Halobacillus salinus]|uniref:TetR/AcrR family transcriptional regulator n=1 Tax=Halobacillus salinus TaxID=192814 RepID=A0A4Z0H3G7_9BACI|nr:TetR/AcrR family transcriptional regulator [Halobacillus salinus]TGB04942.1 TetR/AcrR family transcriptional regulator [Halobacillus salinus]
MSERMVKKFNNRNRLILEAAEKLIKDHGYHQVKMSDISEKLDIAKGTLYSHYRSKEQLTFSIVKPKIDNFLTTMEQIDTSNLTESKKVSSFIEKGFYSDFFHFVLSSFPDMGAIFSEDHNSELKLIQEKIIKIFERVIEEGIKSKTFQTIASSNFLALQLMQLFDPLIYKTLVSSGTMSSKEFVNQSVTFFMGAINNKGEF